MSSYPRTGTEMQRRKRHALGLTPANELTTTRDQLRLFLGNAYLGGMWHGPVASAAAMLALASTSPRGCWPHDMCRRTDLAGSPIMLCTGGNGTVVGEWESLGGSGGGGGGGAAVDITYDGTASGLPADDVQAAIDALASSHGWVPDLEGPPSPLAGLALDWITNGDTEGVIYFAGSAARTTAFTNPVGSKMQALRSSNAAGSPVDLSNRSSGSDTTHTANMEGSWAAIDLGGYALLPQSYSLRHLVPYAADYIRNWKLQGTNAVGTWDAAGISGAAWVDLDTRTDDTTIAALAGWGHWVVPGTPTEHYRYLRILQTGLTSDSSNYLTIAEWEFYGQLLGPPSTKPGLPAGAKGWLKGSGDRFVPYY